jgi:phage gpG-like protein
MSADYSIEISGDALEKIPLLRDQAGIARALARTTDCENQLTVAFIQENYLSFPKDGPVQETGLRVISNRLRGSIRATPAEITADGVTSSIGSNVRYAAIHEFGFDGNEQVSAHVRRRSSVQSFRFGQRLVHRKVRGADIEVRGFTRHMVMPARRPIGRGIEERLPAYAAAFENCITKFWNKENP